MSTGRVRAALFMAIRMAHRWPWRAGAVGMGLILIGVAIGWLGWPGVGMKPAGAGALIVLTVTAWWWARNVARPHSTKTLIRRRAELDQRCGGVATGLDVAELASAKALRLRAKVLRPSTRRLSWWARRRLKATALGVQVARLGWGLWWQQVWSSCEDATMRIGGPRTGKTLSLACHALDAPGALITTSTRLDLAELVQAARLKRGAVQVFNPAGLGGVPSTLRWRALTGCEDYTTAARRAADLIPESTGEGERWDTQARRILALLLNAGALAGRSMRDVVRWTSDVSPEAQRQVVEALLDGGPGGRDRVAAMRAFWATNDRTRTSITTTMSVPLAWMSDDRARELGDADPDDPALIDITELIGRGQTLHLIGHEDHTALSPLIAALVAEIAHAARHLASAQPGGRLDPPLTMVLDEAAIAAPVPLDRWTADMGGRGVTIHISVQSLAQLRGRWGTEGAEAILANVATFLVFGGSPNASDLRDISAITGEHRMKVVGVDHQRDRNAADRLVDDALNGELRGEFRWVPVLSPAQIRALEPGQVLVLRRGLHTLVGWAPRVSFKHSAPLPRSQAEAIEQLEAILTASTLGLQTAARARRITVSARSTLRLLTGELRTLSRLMRRRPAARTAAPADDVPTAQLPAQRGDAGQDGGAA